MILPEPATCKVKSALLGAIIEEPVIVRSPVLPPALIVVPPAVSLPSFSVPVTVSTCRYVPSKTSLSIDQCLYDQLIFLYEI